MKSMTIIITAGGLGKRMGGNLPKQFMIVKNQPIIFHTIHHLHQFDKEAILMVTLPKEWISYWNELLETYCFKVPVMVVEGGKERYDSVKNALENCTTEFVAIHDAVRPFVSHNTLSKLWSALDNSDGVIPVIKVKESLRKIDLDQSFAVARDGYRIVQTPQCFKLQKIKEAYQKDYQSFFTDDASVFEANHGLIHCVEGNDENIKITTPIDLFVAEKLLS